MRSPFSFVVILAFTLPVRLNRLEYCHPLRNLPAFREFVFCKLTNQHVFKMDYVPLYEFHAKQLNKLLGEQLDQVLENLADELWSRSG